MNLVGFANEIKLSHGVAGVNTSREYYLLPALGSLIE